MKPSSFLLIGLLAATTVAITGCRKEKGDPQGEKLAASRPPLPLGDIRQEDVQTQSLLSQKLIASSFKLSAGLGDMVDTLTPTILLTTMLSASENESSEKLIKSIGIHDGRQDRFTKSLQAQLDHLRTFGSSEARFNTAVWMIWPILITPDFQNEIGEKLGVSVYRLGNAGITSTNRIQSWGSEFSPEKKRFDITLDKQEVMIATTVCSMHPVSQPETMAAKHMGHDFHFIKTGAITEAVKITGPNAEGLLGKLDLKAIRKSAKTAKKASLPPLPSSSRNDPKKVLENAGFDYLFTNSNDWRYMAMELRNNGISRIVSFSGVKWRTDAFTPPEPEAVVLLWVPETGLVLGGGKGLPLSRPKS